MHSFVKITSRDNPVIKLAVSLQNSGRSRKEHGLFVIEGLRLCRDAADNGFEFEHLLVSETAYDKHSEVILQLADRSHKCLILSDGVFEKISDTKSPQGIICLCKTPSFETKILSDGKYIGLENLSDPSNLGAVARTAEAFGLDGILLSSGSCDPFSPKALRASMGALLRLPVFVLPDFSGSLKNSGLTLYACVVTPDAVGVADVVFGSGCVALIGNEANGLSDEIISISTPVTIPMAGRAESLNAAVAASVVMWEMVR